MTVEELLKRAIEDWKKLADDWHDRASKHFGTTATTCHGIAEEYEKLIEEAEKKLS
jgi:uncharacterized membrane-anchored protein YhcB (DUF1043 family)